jgi:adenylate cyclase
VGRVRSALDLLERAIERDNTYGRALVLAGVCHHHLEHVTEGAASDAHRQDALDCAQRALRASPDDPGTISDAAFLLGYFDADITAAITLADRAVALNPSYARGWACSGWLRLWAGDPGAAIQHFETACRLNPRQGNATYRNGIGYAEFVQGRFDDAIKTLLAASLEIPGNPTIYRFLASCYAHTGCMEEAREAVTRLKAVAPSVVHMRPPPFRRKEHRELYVSGLRLAAGETE